MLFIAALAMPASAQTDDRARTQAIALAKEELSRQFSRQGRVNTSPVESVDVAVARWRDSSLGCPEKGMVYSPVLTSGYVVTLRAGTERFVVHVGAGRAIVCTKRSTSGQPSPAPTDLPNRRVLLFYSHEPEMDSYEPLDRGLRSALEADKAFVIEFFTEHLDLLRFSTKPQGDALLAYLRSKYTGQPIDLIIVVSPPAFQFVSDHGDQLFPGVPIVFTSINIKTVANARLKPNVTGIGIRREFGDTIDLALRIRPQTREIVIPVGSSALEKTWTEDARIALKPYESRVALTYLDGLSMEEMLVRMRSLPSTTVVLFTPLFYTDAAGKYFLHARALELMSAASSVPIYGTNDTFLGAGIIGGAVADMSVIGAAAGRMAERLLGGATPAQIPVETLNPNSYIFDARQMARFGITRSELPVGSVVLYEQPTAWSQYKGYIIGFGALIAVQFALISLLVVRTRRLKQSDGKKQTPDSQTDEDELPATPAGPPRFR